MLAMYVGVPFLRGPSTPWIFRFDNVAVDLE